ncbi:MAG: hypothetical protein WCJ55_07815 [Chloroflexales bacterium]
MTTQTPSTPRTKDAAPVVTEDAADTAFAEAAAPAGPSDQALIEGGANADPTAIADTDGVAPAAPRPAPAGASQVADHRR